MSSRPILFEPDALEEANMVSKLQEWLMDLTKSKLRSVSSYILQSVIPLSNDKVQQFVRNIIQACEVRPHLISTYAELIGILYQNKTPQNALKSLKPYLIKALLTPKPFIEQFLANVGDFIFLRNICHTINITSEEIVANIRSFCEHHDDLKYYHCLLFCIFAPELQEADPKFYKSLQELFSEEYAAPSCKLVLKYFYENISNLQENNWALQKECIDHGGYKSSIAVALKTDNLDLFQELALNSNSDFNGRIRSSVFEPCQFMQEKPTYIQYAGFHGSLKCFKFLLLNGADLDLTDNLSFTLGHFVIAGGNIEITRLAAQKSCSFEGCLHIATRFFRQELFEWLHTNYFHNLSEIHPRFGSILHESAASNNISQILFCYKNGVDINIKTEDKSTPLHFAVKNRKTDAVRLILRTIGVEVNSKDATGMTPLHIAALFDDPTMTTEVLKNPNVDINMTNSWGMTALCLAAQDGNDATVKALMQREDLDINCKDENSMTPLHYAAQEGEYETVKVLLTSKKIDVECKDTRGLIPFSYAEQSGMEVTAQLLQDFAIKRRKAGNN